MEMREPTIKEIQILHYIWLQEEVNLLQILSVFKLSELELTDALLFLYDSGTISLSESGMLSVNKESINFKMFLSALNEVIADAIEKMAKPKPKLYVVKNDE